MGEEERDEAGEPTGRDRRRLEWRERRRRTNGDAEKREDENDVEKGEEAAKVAVEKGFDAVNKHQHAHGQENHTEQNHLQGDRGFATVLHHDARVIHTLSVSSNLGGSHGVLNVNGVDEFLFEEGQSRSGEREKRRKETDEGREEIG